MKRLIAGIFILVMSMSHVLADNTVRSVDVKAMLDSLGNARICETWSVNIDSSDSEWYLSLSNLGNGRISNLGVRDLVDGSVYLTEDSWNVDRTRSLKAGKCGIVRKGSDSYELCWGVTSNGEHLWEVSYDYENLVTAFSDSCAFNHMFISDGLASPPRSARVEISFPGKEITDSIASIWSFGYDGEIAYRDGCIVAESDGALRNDEGIIVMAAFDRSLFSTSNTSEDSFSVMKNRAFEGSDYITEKSRTSPLEGLLVIVVLLFAAVALIIIYCMGQVIASLGLTFLIFFVIPIAWSTVTLFPLRMYLKRRKLLRGRPYSRDIPEGRNLTRVPYILDRYSYNILATPEDWDNKLTAAYLVRLIEQDAIYIDKTAVDKGQIKPLLHVRKGWTLQPGVYSEADSEAMTDLYKIIKEASGSDFILQDGELKAFKKQEGLKLVKDYYQRRKLDGFGSGADEDAGIMGLEAYLKDFTIMPERDIPEVALWGEYLAYATVFGIADKVMGSMRQMAPDYPLLDKVCDEGGEYILRGQLLDEVCHGIYKLKNEAVKKEKAASSSGNGYGGYSSRSSGGGGRSSHSGGHGHSGGGGGGGR